MIAGVYAIINKINGKRYIGSSHNVIKRYGEHKRALRIGCHVNTYLQRAWNKYGSDSFDFKLLEETSKNTVDREQFHINQHPFKDLYNIQPIAGGTNLGVIFSEEHKKKIGVANKGRKPSDVCKQKHFEVMYMPLDNKTVKCIINDYKKENLSLCLLSKNMAYLLKK